MRKLLAVVFAVSACTSPDFPVAPVAGVAGAALAKAESNGQDRVAVCHQLGNGSYNVLTVAAPAVSAHMQHGDELAGGSVLDANCAPVPVDDPLFFRDDFNGPLDPKHWTVIGTHAVQGGNLELTGASALTFWPTPVSEQIVRVEWEIGLVVVPGGSNLVRVAGACTLLCQDDVTEALFGNEILIRHDSDGIFEAGGPSFSAPDLAPGPHTLRVIWRRGSAAYFVDGVLIGSFTTTLQFLTVPESLQFFKTTRSDTVTITHFQFQAFNRASTI